MTIEGPLLAPRARYVRIAIATAAFVVLVVALVLSIHRWLDPAVRIQQTDLYNYDRQDIPMDGDVVARQTFRATDIARVDVMVSSPRAGRLGVRLLRAEDDVVLREFEIPVPAVQEPVFAVGVFPLIAEQNGRYRFEFEQIGRDAGVILHGSICDCLAYGRASFVPKSPAKVEIGDIHLTTYTVLSDHDRVVLLRDRLEAYRPVWLHRWTFGIAGGALVLLAAAFAATMLVRSTETLRRAPFGAMVLVAVAVPYVVAVVFQRQH